MNYTKKQVVRFCLVLAFSGAGFIGITQAKSDKKVEPKVEQAVQAVHPVQRTEKLTSSKMTILNTVIEFKPWVMLEMFKTYERSLQLNAAIDKDRETRTRAFNNLKEGTLCTDPSFCKEHLVCKKHSACKLPSFCKAHSSVQSLGKTSVQVSVQTSEQADHTFCQQHFICKEHALAKETSAQDKELIKKSLKLVLTPIREFFTVVKDKGNLVKPLLEESLKTKTSILGKFFDTKNDEVFFNTEVTTKDLLQQACHEYIAFFNALEASLTPVAMTKFQQEKAKLFAAREKAELEKKSKK